MEETAVLAEYVAESGYEDVPDEGVGHAKRCIRDIVGLILHGSGHPNGQPVDSYAQVMSGNGEASTVGRGTSDPVNAAFAHGTYGNILNFSDTFESVVIHPSCTVLPAGLAVAETRDVTGRDLLAAYVAGLDVTHRVGRSVAPAHWQRGWHATGTIGVFGATAAAASLLGADAEGIEHAFGMAASFSSGLKKNIPTMANPIHCGNAAAVGVKAALLAEKGGVAADDIFAGEIGYGALMTAGGTYDPTEITDPAVEWAILDNGIKPYPSGAITHSAMETLRSILEREDLSIDDVESVTATVDERLEGPFSGDTPTDATEAGVSYEFCLAAVLRERDVELAHFEEAFIRAPETREAMSKVTVDYQPDPFGPTENEISHGSRIAVSTVDGERHTGAMERLPGTPTNPLQERRLKAKFYDCAETVLDRESAEAIERAVMNLEADGGLSDLSAAIRSAA